MSNLVKRNNANLPAAFGGSAADNAIDELAGGITGGFAVVSLRGKNFHIKYQGEERTLLDETDRPLWSIDVVIIKASPHVSKQYYINGYESGSTDAPDCWSTDGLKPDPTVPDETRQHPVCATCRHNAFGSSNTGKGKACADNKRLVVVPAEDVANDGYGGPMLLRVPPASLKELPALASKLRALGYQPHQVVTRMTFGNTEYPSLLFAAVRPITDEDEAQIIMDMRADPRTARILDEAVEVAAAAEQAPAQEGFLEAGPAAKPAAFGGEPEQTAEAPKQRQATQKKAEPKKAEPKAAAEKPKAAAKQPEPQQEEEEQQSEGDQDEGEEEGSLPSSFMDTLDSLVGD